VLHDIEDRHIAASRVWWVPTGMLTVLPLHAAGRYGGGPRPSVLDRTVCSFAHTIKALRSKRRDRAVTAKRGSDLQFVAAGAMAASVTSAASGSVR